MSPPSQEENSLGYQNTGPHTYMQIELGKKSTFKQLIKCTINKDILNKCIETFKQKECKQNKTLLMYRRTDVCNYIVIYTSTCIFEYFLTSAFA